MPGTTAPTFAASSSAAISSAVSPRRSAYGLGRLVGLDAMAALAAVGLAVAIGVFELTQDLVRARLMVVTAMKATLVRAAAALCLGVVAALLGTTGFLLLVSSTLAYLLAVLVQRVGLAGNGAQIRRRRPCWPRRSRACR